jgi:hypothetical protein
VTLVATTRSGRVLAIDVADSLEETTMGDFRDPHDLLQVGDRVMIKPRCTTTWCSCCRSAPRPGRRRRCCAG